ncbi:outer membrane autotransporter protein [Ochrobactrum sp. BH3]|nr:outer membrane autotransporter protein [Ochrobactrum sp. BH3]
MNSQKQAGYRALVTFSAICYGGIQLYPTTVLAYPLISHSGTVTPLPPTGSTDWIWSNPSDPLGANLLIQAGSSLRISDGATAKGSGLAVFDKGSIIVDGSNSSLSVSFTTRLSGGMLRIQNGAHMIANADTLLTGIQVDGSSSEDIAEVIVNGAGSNLTSNSAISIGTFGPGRLTITDGAHVYGRTLSIGDLSSATVSGQGASWNGEAGVWVGSRGFGQLNVNDGASINDNFLQIAPNGGSTGIVNIGGVEGEVARPAGTLNVNSIVFNQNGDEDDNGFGFLNFNTTNGTTVRADIRGIGTIHQIAGETILSGNNSAFEGNVIITGGALIQAAEKSFSSAADYTVGTNSLIDLGGYKTTLASLSNNGTVLFGNNAGSVITVRGNYISDAGMIVLNSVLGDDNSKTDLLEVDGDTSGTGTLKVINRGGLGAQTTEGIRIIEVDGQSNGKFYLLGDYITKNGQQAVVAGAYAYSLYEGGASTPNDGDWYLRSQLQPTDPVDPVDTIDPVEPEPLYQAGVPVYENYPQALLGLNGISTLQQRIGSRVWTGNGNRVVTQGADAIGSPYAAPNEAGAAINGNGVWGRIEGSHNQLEPRFSNSGANYNQNILKMQAGIDGMLTETENGQLIGGLTVHYAHGKTKTNSAHGDGDISTEGYGLGGTLTWYGENGFYLDGQGQVTWYRSDLHSTTANTGLTDNNHGFGYALSLEGGQRFAINDAWSVTPQAQLTYSNVDFDAFTDAFGADVSLDRGESLQGRLGLTVDHENSWQNANGMMDRTRVYGIANLYYEFLQGIRVIVGESSFTSRNDRVWGGLGLGGSYNWNDDRYSIYGEGLVNTSLNNFGDSYSIKGVVGFKVKW